MESEFYIGYLEKAPQGVSKHLVRVVMLLAILMVLLAWILASHQRGFDSSTYQYGEETALTGVLLAHPIPSVQLLLGNTHDGKPILQIIPLVQFGKIGGAGLIELWQEQVGTWVTVRGHLIFYDGKTLMDVVDANQDIEPQNAIPQDISFNETSIQYDPLNVTLVGEIVDAKCFFGVMKPGHGKPHRSCAIRCISGGIPAVLRVRDKMDHYSYYLLEGDNTGRDIAAYIGEAVEIKGKVGQFGDWNILQKKNAEITPLGSLIGPEMPLVLTLCN